MNAVTQCPACGTLFRVVDDQLRISQGWVRCGQCHEVFNAQLSLSGEALPQAQPTAAASTEPIQLPSGPGGFVVAHPGESAGALVSEPTPQPDHLPAAAAAVTVPSSDVGQLTPNALADKAPQAAIGSTAPSFMTTPAEANRLWQRALVWALSVVLLVCLTLQLVWVYRDRLATYWPQLHPVLSSACAAVGCTVSPLMQLDAWVLDDVAVSPVAGAHRLTLSLRNGAAVALAVPAIELSLQDANDKLVLRRVLSPKELNIERPSLGAGEEFNVSVSMTLRDTNGAPFKRIAGYKVIAFYP